MPITRTQQSINTSRLTTMTTSTSRRMPMARDVVQWRCGSSHVIAFAPTLLAIAHLDDWRVPNRWVAIEAIETAPPHGPPVKASRSAPRLPFRL
jgi:hypothetical protein